MLQLLIVIRDDYIGYSKFWLIQIKVMSAGSKDLPSDQKVKPETFDRIGPLEFAPHANSVPVPTESSLASVSDEHKIIYILEGHEANIYKPIYNSGMYQIEWNHNDMGYIYISHLDEVSDRQVWIASTPFLEVYLHELSSFIEHSEF
jgi:hypothetical protein